jgi:hypothetical protein
LGKEALLVAIVILLALTIAQHSLVIEIGSVSPLHPVRGTAVSKLAKPTYCRLGLLHTGPAHWRFRSGFM